MVKAKTVEKPKIKIKRDLVIEYRKKITETVQKYMNYEKLETADSVIGETQVKEFVKNKTLMDFECNLLGQEGLVSLYTGITIDEVKEKYEDMDEFEEIYGKAKEELGADNATTFLKQRYPHLFPKAPEPEPKKEESGKEVLQSDESGQSDKDKDNPGPGSEGNVEGDPR